MRLLLKILKHIPHDEYISGDVLSERLGISRQAISQTLATAPDYQVKIHAVRGKGYRLMHALSFFDKAKLAEAFAALPGLPNRTLFTLDTVDSTMDVLWREAAQLGSGSVAVTEHQQQGRGRYGRTWVSPLAQNLYLSVLWKWPLSLSEATQVTLSLAVCLLETLQALGLSNSLGIKWPNDIYLNGAKLAGILVDAQGEMDGRSTLVIGCGVNLFPVECERLTANIGGDKTELAIALINNIYRTLNEYAQNGFSKAFTRWNTYDILRGQRITVKRAEGVTLEGIGRGINAQGELLLQKDHEFIPCRAGEVSIGPYHSADGLR